MKATNTNSNNELPKAMQINGLNRVFEYRSNEVREYISKAQDLLNRDSKHQAEYYFNSAHEVIRYLDGMLFTASTLGINTDEEEAIASELFELWNHAAN